MEFGRLITAMVTAFHADGQLDIERQKKVIEHLLQTGTESIVVAGTTGESPTLSSEEKLQLFELTVELARGKGKVIAGTGSNNTQESIRMTQRAEACGVDGIMLVTPYYNKPNQEGLYQHFKAVAESTPLPIMLYNIPGRAAIHLEVETVARLAEIPNIQMIKEASGDLAVVSEIIQSTPDDFLVYSGDDNQTLPILALGGHGIVSVAAHVVGKEMKQMVQAYVDGRVGEAKELYHRLYPKCKALFLAPNPVPVKRVLEHIGVEVGPLRLPLVPLTREEEETILSYY